jgi:PIN domain nuclease of toxin-antitoxin system
MRLLLDTHIIIWLANDDPRISKVRFNQIKSADEVYVSFVSGWEYGQLRLKRPETWEADFETLISTLPAQKLDLAFGVHIYAEQLPPIHKDPFDRMLIAQALFHDLTLVTADEKISHYPVSVLW